MITNASLLKNYIFGAFIRYKTGTLQDALIICFRDAMLLARRWPVLHKLLSIQLAPVHLRMGKRPTGTLDVLEICPRGNNKLVIIIFPCS